MTPSHIMQTALDSIRRTSHCEQSRITAAQALDAVGKASAKDAVKIVQSAIAEYFEECERLSVQPDRMTAIEGVAHLVLCSAARLSALSGAQSGREEAPHWYHGAGIDGIPVAAATPASTNAGPAGSSDNG